MTFELFFQFDWWLINIVLSFVSLHFEPTGERTGGTEKERQNRETVKAEGKNEDNTIRFFSIDTEQNELPNPFIFGFYSPFI